MSIEIESAWPAHPGYRIDVTPHPAVGRVWSGDVLVAESDACLLVQETKHVDRLYFPEAHVRWEHFTPTETGSVCPFKGQASYWSLVGPDGVEDDVVWTYRTPFAEVGGIEGHVCFYEDRLRVELSETWPDGSVVTTRFPTWGDESDLLELIDVEPAGDGRFVGPARGWSRRDVVEGGQQLAEAIVAASKSSPAQRVTSASMVFSKAATFREPTDVVVDVLRGGRTFSTLQVALRQEGALRSTALVLMDSGAPDVVRHQAEMPDVAGPQDSELVDFGVTGREIRVVDGAYTSDPDRVAPPEICAWVRFRDAPPEPHLHTGLLAQSTTHWTIAAAMLPHPGIGQADAHRTISTGPMQISLALHDDVDVTEWLLYENRAIWAGRGLAQGEGRVFTRSGRLVASYSVQAMVRAAAQDLGEVGGERSAM
jgi:acyl-CoA thioesterase-2